MKDMRVAEYHYEGFGDENNPESDWCLLNKNAIFSHIKECEFMVWLGDEEIDVSAELKKVGFSTELIALCMKAKSEGYRYICLYG